MSEHADQFEEREKGQGDESGSQEGIEQANRESGSGPRGADSQRQEIKEQPGTTEVPSAD